MNNPRSDSKRRRLSQSGIAGLSRDFFGSRNLSLAMLTWCLCLGCQPGLNKQPRVGKPDSASMFFSDGQTNRSAVPGTVARGAMDDDTPRITGKADGQYVKDIPMPLTESLLSRGRERFNISCAQCHDRTGSGNGKVVSRGLIKPPSYHTDDSRGLKLRGQAVKLTEVPAGYIFDVITNGYGAMGSHGDIVMVDDRWAIIAYIRALQLAMLEGDRDR